MIEKCNFKQKKATLSGTTVSDCILCNPTIFVSAYSCPGEQDCILYQIYRRVEDSTL